MTIQRLLALAGTLLFLVLAALMVRKKEAPIGFAASPLATAASADVERIQIVGLSSMTLVNDGGVWRLAAPVTDIAQPQAVESLLTNLREFTFGSVVSDNAERHGQFGVNAASAIHIAVYMKGKAEPALDLLLGKPTTSGGGSFVRDPSGIDVRTADGLSAALVTGPADNYRERAVVPLAPGSIDGLSATWNGGSLALAKSSETWTNVANGMEVSEERAAAVISAISGLRISWFTNRIPGGASEFELGVSSGSARITVSFGATERNAQGESLRRVYVEGRPTIMLVPEPAPTDLIALLRSLR